MKKVLFATTALVMTAGVASAEVTLDGLAMFGVISDERKASGDDFVLQHNVDLFVRLRGETDTGLSFGANIDLEDLEDSRQNSCDPDPGDPDFCTDFTDVDGDGYPSKQGRNETSGTNVFFGGTYGTMTYGNTDGAFDKRITEVHRIIGLDYEMWTENQVDNDDNENILRYDYDMGDLGVSLSYAGEDDAKGISVGYAGTFANYGFNVGLAYEDSDDGYLWGASAGTKIADMIELRTAYWKGEDDTPDQREQWDISAAYNANGILFGANYLMDQDWDEDYYTVFAEYELGEGAKLFAQHGKRDERRDGDEEKITSMGVSFSF
ncbi:porin [uncultured Paracoccus sp.]|uniref:porin n=1 Tax=uncultured Paracoccus sp. TaxID=189685 RepID=UPI002614D5B7|nr:porin [uncultured Paracoccus sp.]